MSFWDKRGLACAPPWVNRDTEPRYHAYQRILLSPDGKKALDNIEERERAGELGHQEARILTFALIHAEGL